jgi:tRNA threonylcarbamoyladenosine biosynthesis protein TsaE
MHAPHFTADEPARLAACLTVDLPDEAATQTLGAALAQTLVPGLVIFLEGDLGAGKTTLARALIRALGHAGPVKSPTYALVEVYVVSSLYLYHFDFYRFESAEEFLDAGFDEYFNAASVCLVEWPDKAAGCVPSPDLRVLLQHQGNGREGEGREGGRRIEFVACSERGASCVEQLKTHAADSCAGPAPA